VIRIQILWDGAVTPPMTSGILLGHAKIEKGRAIDSVMDPRPTIDVDAGYCPDLDKKRQKELRKHIHTSRVCNRLIKSYRELQISLIYKLGKTTKKEAKESSCDPSPYDEEYVFYCLK